MNKPKMRYFEKEDVIHIVISDEKEAGSVEIGPSITAELNEKGELIGVEILNASKYLRDMVLEGAQARRLHLSEPSEPTT